ncbi:MAG: cyanophycin synthetase, partial [Rhodocyclaceae bacterium]|nr:cyanophycin synthetase [Rhodocyclaceae bacterium]
LFSADAALPVIVEHRSKGGRALVVRDGHIMLAAGAHEAPLIELDAIPLLNESAEHLAGIFGAIGAGWALGLSPEILRAGIETYHFHGADADAATD